MGNGIPMRLVCRKVCADPATWQATLWQNGRETFTTYAGKRDDALRTAMRHMLAVADAEREVAEVAA